MILNSQAANRRCFSDNSSRRNLWIPKEKILVEVLFNKVTDHQLYKNRTSVWIFSWQIDESLGRNTFRYLVSLTFQAWVGTKWETASLVLQMLENSEFPGFSKLGIELRVSKVPSPKIKKYIQSANVTCLLNIHCSIIRTEKILHTRFSPSTGK